MAKCRLECGVTEWDMGLKLNKDIWEKDRSTKNVDKKNEE